MSEWLEGLRGLWDWLGQNAPAIQAATSIALLLVAIAAAIVAAAQVGEARRLRREQAQPYVVVGMRPGSSTPNLIELFVRNYGATAAFDVRMVCDPPLTSQWEAGVTEQVDLFDVLPTMAPGEEWVTLWDNSENRWSSGQALASRATITYKDSLGTLHSVVNVLDWDAHKNRTYVARKDTHDIATTLAKVSTNLTKVIQGGAIIIQDKQARREELLHRQEARRIGVNTGEGDHATSDTEPISSRTVAALWSRITRGLSR